MNFIIFIVALNLFLESFKSIVFTISKEILSCPEFRKSPKASFSQKSRLRTRYLIIIAIKFFVKWCILVLIFFVFISFAPSESMSFSLYKMLQNQVGALLILSRENKVVYIHLSLANIPLVLLNLNRLTIH